MSADRNKARTLELIQRVMNGHDPDALHEYTSNPAVVAAADTRSTTPNASALTRSDSRSAWLTQLTAGYLPVCLTKP
jgi:hypothetical protein